MANYLIIGGDGKEYGPVTDVDVRQWLAEGRLNAQSLAKAESDAEFRPLAVFPEFADAFAAAVAQRGNTRDLLGRRANARGHARTREFVVRHVTAPRWSTRQPQSSESAYS